MQTRDPAGTQGADAEFRRRSRTAYAILALWGIGSLGRMPYITEHWPAIGAFSLWFFMLGSIAVCAAFYRAFRCALCGGGIKLNGRTCARCGHVYP